jgi:hypothetical protein
VVAVDMTVAPEAPYPVCVQDANYAVRWLKPLREPRTSTGERDSSQGVSVFCPGGVRPPGEALKSEPRRVEVDSQPDSMLIIDAVGEI